MPEFYSSQTQTSQSPTAAPEVQALLDQAKKARGTRKFDEATVLYDQALAKARELKDRKGEADALRRRGFIYFFLSQYPNALECFSLALSLHRALGDKDGEVRALNNSASIYAMTGRLTKAMALLNQALPT